ncbi:MAG: alpha/beta fold hydrolase, partial [Candidatus Kariarchaeaceae archaeon]
TGDQSWREYIQNPMIWKNITALNIPTIILQAEKDVRPNWPAKQLASLLPNAKYREINEAVHCIWLTHPNELKIELRSFLNLLELES